MRIAVDLDGVVVDSVPYWIAVVNREAGTAYGPGDLPQGYATPEMAAICDAHEVEMLVAPHPVPGARAACARLRADGHRLIAVTARAPRMRRLTEAWLDYHGIALDDLLFLQGAPKLPVIQAEGLALLIEDTPAHALSVAAAGIPVLLFSAPYNRAVQHPGICRCEGWHGVLGAVPAWSAGPAAAASGGRELSPAGRERGAGNGGGAGSAGA